MFSGPLLLVIHAQMLLGCGTGRWRSSCFDVDAGNEVLKDTSEGKMVMVLAEFLDYRSCCCLPRETTTNVQLEHASTFFVFNSRRIGLGRIKKNS